MSLIRQALLVLVCAVVGFGAALAAVASGWAHPSSNGAEPQVRALSARVASDDRQIATFTTEIEQLTRLAGLEATRGVTASINTSSGCPKGKAFYTLYDSNGAGPIPGTGIAICVPTG